MSEGHVEDRTGPYSFGIVNYKWDILNDVFEVWEGFKQFIRDFSDTTTNVNHDAIARD